MYVFLYLPFTQKFPLSYKQFSETCHKKLPIWNWAMPWGLGQSLLPSATVYRIWWIICRQPKLWHRCPVLMQLQELMDGAVTQTDSADKLSTQWTRCRTHVSCRVRVRPLCGLLASCFLIALWQKWVRNTILRNSQVKMTCPKGNVDSNTWHVHHVEWCSKEA